MIAQDISFGRWLRLRRRELDLTQELLAERVGCSVDLIGKIERGERRPSREIATRLLEQLEAPLEERAELLRRARGLAETPAPAEAPLAPAEARPPSGLPALPAALLGRDDDLAAIVAALRGGETRLLTLVGPGGVGKSSLALAAGHALAGDFADGARLIALASLRDAALLPSTLAQALGIGEYRGGPTLGCVIEVLREQELLLLLDNLEQLLAGGPLIAELLAACPRLHILATSRAPLRLRGEQTYAVAPLALPASDERDLDALARTPAVALFVRAARAVYPAFALSDESAPAVAAICRRLDGLPLAIELAAARAGLFSPAALLERLERRLPLLEGGARDLPARQRTLRAAIAWSYELLDDPARCLFERLGVFAGGLTLEGAEALTPEPELRAGLMASLEALLDNSLLLRADDHHHQQQGAGPRLRMLELIREYALERLAERGETDAALGRHARYALELAERGERELWGGQQREWLRRLAAENENLRAALQWSIASDPPLALRMARALWYYWALRSRFCEGRAFLAQAIAANRRALDGCLGRGEDERALRSRIAGALNVAGKLAEYQGDVTQARAQLEEALAIARALGDEQLQAGSLLYLGRAARVQGDIQAAEEQALQSLATFRALDDLGGLIWALLTLADIMRDAGRLAEAGAYLDEAFALSSTRASAGELGPTLLNLGRVAYDRGALDEADAHFAEALGLFRALEAPWGMGEVLLGKALVAQARGDWPAASELFRESLRLMRGLDGWAFVAASVEGLAGVTLAQGDAQRAARLYGVVAALHERFAIRTCQSMSAGVTRDLEQARHQLDADSWRAAYEAGRTLSTDRLLSALDSL